MSDTFDLFDAQLMERMGIQPILPIKVSIISDTMLDVDGHGHGDITCRYTFTIALKVTGEFMLNTF